MSVLFIALGIGAAWGVTNSQIHSFEKTAARDISALLQGENRHVSVKTKPAGVLGPVFGDVAWAKIVAKDFQTAGLPLFVEPDRSQAGNLRELQLDLRNFSLGGLQIDSLQAKIPGCKFDLGLAISKRKIRLSKSGVGTGQVVVSQAALEPWIVKSVPEIKRVSVVLDKDYALVTGYGEFLVAKTDFYVLAKLTIRNGVEIHLTDAKVMLGWQSAEEFSRKVLLDALNPVVDLRESLGLQDAFFLEKIELQDGKMTASGRTKIPTRPPADKKNPEVSRGEELATLDFSRA